MKPLERRSEGFEIVEDELRLFGRVSGALTEISTNSVGAPDYDDALISLRDQMSEAKPEDLPALVEQMTRIAALAQNYGKGRDLPVDPTSPYFAHIRLEEDQRTRDVLIGKRGYIDRERRVQIVDWRNAPVSRIFYRYEEGDDYEEELGERMVEGRVAVRRNVTIDDGRLVRIGCPQGTYTAIDDDWVEAAPVSVPELKGGQGKAARPPVIERGSGRSKLGVHSDRRRVRADKHLPEIAALIDPQQFDLITRPDSGLVVLQGGAGTGKTTVALHRVAYLNYQRPKVYRPDRILIIVPSIALVNYVQRVLPSLGVQGVRVVTAELWLQRTRQKIFKHLTASYHDDTPAVVLRFKKHPMMLDALSEYVAEQVQQTETELRAAMRDLDQSRSVMDAWRKAKDDVLISRLLAVRTFLRNARLPIETHQRADSCTRKLLKRAQDFLADWADMLTDRKRLSSLVARFCPGEFTERQLDTICTWCTRQSDLAQPEEDDDQEPESMIAADGIVEDVSPPKGSLDQPDDALLLALCFLKRGELRPATGSAIVYEHLVADEAQDLSVIELKVLMEATSDRKSITLAGDTAQRLVFDNAFSDWESLLERLHMPAATNTTLTLGYRSTSEVMALANSLLGSKAPKNPAHAARTGAPVELHRFNDQGEAVAMLSDALRSLVDREPNASVALITRHSAQAKMYHHALNLADVPGLRLVQRQDFAFKPGIEVTHVSHVKGLEFDYVILLDVTPSNYPDTMESRHLLHIGATRAAHQLWLVSVGQPSPLLPNTL
jgi:DNA helicase-2/ATP-dependent DNA helicase PcrA